MNVDLCSPDLAAPQSILRVSLDRAMLSIEKFSRWLRAICTVLLSRNSATDRTKAAGYVEQAVRVLQEHGAEGGLKVGAILSSAEFIGPEG